MERRLSAILAADMVGYSRAMQADEAGTLAALTRFRKDAIEPLVAMHRGRIVKLMGDGVLAEFASIVDAVACAVAWQERAAASDLGTPLQFRIGVNLGDIVAEDGDIYGTGVNVAARLQTLAQPGDICMSGIVHGEVKGKLDLGFEDLGDQTVKNIEGPVRAWRVSSRPVSAPTSMAAVHARARHQKPSVAILPFVNMSGDPEQEYFSDGITEDIITEVSRFRELFVSARNSSFAFKGKNPDIREVGQKLGVQFVVEGSVRRAANKVRVTAQLIEAATGNHIWAERYDRDLADIFEVQDELAHSVASRVAGRIALTASERALQRPTGNMTAYDHYLRGLGIRSNYVVSETYDTFLDCVGSLRKAIELDPGFAGAHAVLAQACTIHWFYRSSEAPLEEALAAAEKAVVLDPNDSACNTALGFVLMHLRQLDEAKSRLEKAIQINPNDSWAQGARSFCLAYMGRYDDALVAIDEALRLDPLDLNWFWDGRGTFLMLLHRYEEAVDAFRQMSWPMPWTLLWQAICLAKLGRLDDARSCLTKYFSIPGVSAVDDMIEAEAYRDRSVIAGLKAMLRETGLVDASGRPVLTAPASGGSPPAAS